MERSTLALRLQNSPLTEIGDKFPTENHFMCRQFVDLPVNNAHVLSRLPLVLGSSDRPNCFVLFCRTENHKSSKKRPNALCNF